MARHYFLPDEDSASDAGASDCENSRSSDFALPDEASLAPTPSTVGAGSSNSGGGGGGGGYARSLPSPPPPTQFAPPVLDTHRGGRSLRRLFIIGSGVLLLLWLFSR